MGSRGRPGHAADGPGPLLRTSGSSGATCRRSRPSPISSRSSGRCSSRSWGRGRLGGTSRGGGALIVGGAILASRGMWMAGTTVVPLRVRARLACHRPERVYIAAQPSLGAPSWLRPPQKQDRAMNDTESLFSVLRRTADPEIVAAIEELVAKGTDRDLNRINALAFAAKHGFEVDDVIAAFLHAARLGIFEMAWNVLCPGCGGVLGAAPASRASTRTSTPAGSAPPATSRPSTKWSRSPSRSARASGASPPTIRTPCRRSEYFRQIFWGSGNDLPGEYRARPFERDRPSTCSNCRRARRRCSPCCCPKAR